MSGINQYNWELLLQQVKEALKRGCIPTWVALSKELNIPRTSLASGFDREYNIRAENLPGLLDLADGDAVDIEFGRYTVKEGDFNKEITIDIDTEELKTLDEMLTMCKVDLEVWGVDHYLINKYPGYRRDEKIDVTWEDGRIVEGYKKDDGKLTVVALFQVKVWLKRKIPLQPEILIQPVNVTYSSERPKIQKRVRDTYSALIIPDTQFGFFRDFETGELTTFHDREALDVAVAIAELLDPDKVVYLGDMLDLADWSNKFVRSPEMAWNTQSAVIEASWWLNEFKRVTPNAKHELLLGNHDKRMELAIITRLKEAYFLKPADELELPPALSVQRLIALDKIGIEYHDNYPHNEIWIGNYIKCIHGDIARKNPGATTNALIENSEVTIIQGHIHRIELISRVIYTRDISKTVYGFSPGCLCKIDGTVPGSSSNNQWQNGVGVVYYDNEGNHTITPIPIKDGVALFQGITLEAEDRLEQIKRDTNWKF